MVEPRHTGTLFVLTGHTTVILPPLSDATLPLTYEFVASSSLDKEASYPQVVFQCALGQTFAASSMVEVDMRPDVTFEAQTQLVLPRVELKDVPAWLPTISFGTCSFGHASAHLKVRVQTARNATDGSLWFRLTGTALLDLRAV
jgi:hypothetical protein